jgi:hypothetical protein
MQLCKNVIELVCKQKLLHWFIEDKRKSKTHQIKEKEQNSPDKRQEKR